MPGLSRLLHVLFLLFWFDGFATVAAEPSYGFWPWGEALNPGPCSNAFTTGSDLDLLACSFSNPTGLRGKEGHLIDLGPGIHACSETQLSSVTQPSCARQLKSLARTAARNLRVHFGAPAPLRSNSDWAGSWTGVAVISDYPSFEVHLPYSEERACGRLLTTRHLIGSFSLLHVTVYGFPPGRGPLLSHLNFWRW